MFWLFKLRLYTVGWLILLPLHMAALMHIYPPPVGSFNPADVGFWMCVANGIINLIIVTVVLQWFFGKYSGLRQRIEKRAS